jgi:hypothetical protein
MPHAPKNSIEASHFSPDILKFIPLLQAYQVKYVVVGGEAVIYHGYPRFTGDVDFSTSEPSKDRRQAGGGDTRFRICSPFGLDLPMNCATLSTSAERSVPSAPPGAARVGLSAFE